MKLVYAREGRLSDTSSSASAEVLLGALLLRSRASMRRTFPFRMYTAWRCVDGGAHGQAPISRSNQNTVYPSKRSKAPSLASQRHRRLFTFASTAHTASSCADPVAAPTDPLPSGFAGGPFIELVEDNGDTGGDDTGGDTQALDGQAKEPVSGLIAKLNLPRGLSRPWPYLSPTVQAGFRQARVRTGAGSGERNALRDERCGPFRAAFDVLLGGYGRWIVFGRYTLTHTHTYTRLAELWCILGRKPLDVATVVRTAECPPAL